MSVPPFTCIFLKGFVGMIKPSFLNLRELANRLEHLKIDNTKCLKNESPLSHCNLCANTCPTKGLKFVNGTWEIEECTLCGNCVSLCPAEVFRIDEKRILEETHKKEQLLLTCLEDKSTDYGLKINCFKQLTPEFLFRLLAHTDEVVLAVSEKACQLCSNTWSKFILETLLERYHLDCFRLKIFTTENELASLKESSKDSRRKYLKASYQSILNQGANLALYEMKNYRLLEEEEEYSKRFYLYQDYKDKFEDQQTVPYPLLAIRECHFCGACEKLCPKEALKIFTNDEKKHLLFHPVLCNQCKLCEEICVAKGIFWSDFLPQDKFFSGKWQEVAKATQRLCPTCGQSYFSHKDKAQCYFCEKKENNNFTKN